MAQSKTNFSKLQKHYISKFDTPTYISEKNNGISYDCDFKILTSGTQGLCSIYAYQKKKKYKIYRFDIVENKLFEITKALHI